MSEKRNGVGCFGGAVIIVGCLWALVQCSQPDKIYQRGWVEGMTDTSAETVQRTFEGNEIAANQAFGSGGQITGVVRTVTTKIGGGAPIVQLQAGRRAILNLSLDASEMGRAAQLQAGHPATFQCLKFVLVLGSVNGTNCILKP